MPLFIVDMAVTSLKRLGISVLTLIQLAIAGVLLVYVWAPIVIVYGLINLIWVLLTGNKVGNPMTVMEAPKWYYHQVAVLFAFSDDFRVAPYVA
jgi:hypothetical protein